MASNNIRIGVGCIGVGGWMIVSGIRKNNRCSGRATGRITGIHESHDTDNDGNSSTSYSPVFAFEVKGRIYRGIGNIAYNKRKKVKIGGDIRICYNPMNPEEHYTKGGGVIQPFLGLMLIILGVILITTAQKA